MEQQIHTQSIRIEEYLLQEISKGLTEPGFFLPTELEIARKFSVSRYKVRDVLWKLSTEGYIRRIQGKGTVVSFHKYESNWRVNKHSVQPIRETHLGQNPYSILNSAFIEYPERKTMNFLGIKSTEKVYRFDVVRYIADKPFNYSTAWLPELSFPGLKDVFDGSKSLYDVLREEYKVDIHQKNLSIEIIFAEEQDCQILDVKKGAPLYLMDSVYADETGKPIEYRTYKIRSDMYKMNFNFEKE